jgi:HK97 family phage major capsid protein
MKTIKQLHEEHQQAVEAAEALEEKRKKEERPFADEERTQFKELLETAQSLKAEIEAVNKSIKEDSERAQQLETLALPPVKNPTLDADPGEKRKIPATPKDPEWTFGEYLLACRNAAQSQGRIIDPRLMLEMRQTGASEGTPADGGFFVQTQHNTEVLQRAYTQGALWSRCRKITIGPNANGLTMNGVNETSRADGSRSGGVLGYWLAEAGVKTKSKPTFRQIELNLKKVAALWYATDELLQDSTAVSQIASKAFTDELIWQVEDAIINGTGAGMPLGILASGCLVTVAAEPAQANTTIVAQNIMKMYSRMYPESIPNAVWFINQDCWPQIFQLSLAVGAGGAPLFVPPGGISAAPYGTLMGRPIVPIEYCATLGTVGDIIFADLNHYITIDKGGIQAASSIHVKFTYDETVFRWVLRVDGQPDATAALIPYKGAANTLSAFVVLAGRP